MNILIPMAGMGKRLRPHTLTTPKPLLPIAGKPMVHRIVEDIVATCNEPIENIGFICGNFGEQAEQELIQVAAKFGAKGKIYYQHKPQGTAHALLCAEELLTGHVFIAFADTLFDAKFEIDTNKDAIIWTHRVANPSNFGVVILNNDGTLQNFVEKPKEFVSDMAIIGVYYFKDGNNLKNECNYLIENNITGGGEYQLTDAMENMRIKGLPFYTGEVNEWLDCGNAENTLETNTRILDLKKDTESLINTTNLINATIIEPCYIGPNTVIENSTIGPFASIEANAVIKNSIVKNSIIRDNAQIIDANLDQSLVGSFATFKGNGKACSIGDYTIVQQ
jgi:glucose-1-phosphate thymidylyltransferase